MAVSSSCASSEGNSEARGMKQAYEGVAGEAVACTMNYSRAMNRVFDRKGFQALARHAMKFREWADDLRDHVSGYDEKLANAIVMAPGTVG